jgi:hypothetical protein
MTIAVEAFNFPMFRLLLHFPDASIDRQLTATALIHAIRKQDKNMIRFVSNFTRFLVFDDHRHRLRRYMNQKLYDEMTYSPYWDDQMPIFVGEAISTKSLDTVRFVLDQLKAHYLLGDQFHVRADLIARVSDALVQSDDPQFISYILELQKLIPESKLILRAVRGNAFVLLNIITRGDMNFFRQRAIFPFFACQTVDMAQYLFDRGADANVIGRDGESYLSKVRRTGNTELADFLVARGVHP